MRGRILLLLAVFGTVGPLHGVRALVAPTHHRPKAAPSPRAARTTPAPVPPASASAVPAASADLVEDDDSVRIDWTTWELTVTGLGLAPDRGALAFRRTLARRAAYADGYQRLASALERIRVSGGAYLEDLTIADDALRTKVNAFVQGATLSDTHNWPDGSVEVHLTVPLAGPHGLASLVLPDGGTTVPLAPAGGYTGIIVDGRDVGAQAALTLSLLDTDGDSLFPPAKGPSSVHYFHGFDAAQKAAGPRALLVKAHRAAGATRADLVLDQEDADELSAVEQKTTVRSVAVVL